MEKLSINNIKVYRFKVETHKGRVQVTPGKPETNQAFEVRCCRLSMLPLLMIICMSLPEL